MNYYRQCDQMAAFFQSSNASQSGEEGWRDAVICSPVDVMMISEAWRSMVLSRFDLLAPYLTSPFTGTPMAASWALIW